MDQERTADSAPAGAESVVPATDGSARALAGSAEDRTDEPRSPGDWRDHLRATHPPVTDTRHPAPTPRLFGEFLDVVRRYWATILIAALNVIAIVAILTAQAPSLYAADANVLVRATTEEDDLNLATEAELIQSNIIAERVVDALTLDDDPDDVASGVGVDLVEDTEILEVTYTADSREEARVRAQAFVDAYLDYRGEQAEEALAGSREAIQSELDTLQQQLSEINEQLLTAEASQVPQLQAQLNLISNRIVDRQVQLAEVEARPPVGTVLRAAKARAQPVSPDPVRNMAVGVVGGLLLGLAIAAVRDQLDTRVHSAADVEEMLPTSRVVAMVPRHKPFQANDGAFLTSLFALPSTTVEAYRAVAIEVGTTLRDLGSRSVLVTGAGPSAGTSTVSAALAAMMARTGRRVILVSGNTHEPVVEGWFHVPVAPGLADVLLGQASIDDVLRSTPVSGLAVVPIGTESRRAPERLASEDMVALNRSLAARVDMVVYDMAPIGRHADVLGAVQAVGDILLVTPTGVPRELLSRADRQIQQVGGRLVGTVVRDVGRRPHLGWRG